ncbi:ATPase [Erythrobacter sp. SG61-1L]|uniref:sensor histidine kinase n=1 Tax=Erythrobacter sp. SG61-1L TaxID=1603897 RepID=UPI0006C8E9C1|nr:ATP-binding protein [Erythrobacter sp. SG61-1L]KPL67586.1 ATPase [Erythrobacter sp. SG61-1L]
MPDAHISKGRSWPRWSRRALVSARRANIFGILEVLSAITLAVMVVWSWAKLFGQPIRGGLVPSGEAAALLIGTLIPAMTLLVLVGRRIAIRRAGGKTARLHVRLVFFFSLVAAIPTLLVSIFASFLFQTGVEFWFSDRQRGIIETANELARGYYDQNQRQLADNTTAMAGDLRYVLTRYSLTSAEFPEQYYLQATAREINRSAIVQKRPEGGFNIAAIVDPDEDDLVKRVVGEALPKIDAGEDVVVTASEDRIEAVAAIDRGAGVYLYNARNSDALALSQWKRAQSVVSTYEVLTSSARKLQLRFNLLLFFVSLGLVGLAIWFALRFADRQVRPLTDLVGAAREVGQGNYALRVEGRTGPDEIGLLNRAFNRMTAQIEQQTTALMNANEQLEERRAFIETVLESITAGIVSVDEQGNVLLMNSSAQKLLLDRVGPAPVGLKLAEIGPEIAAMLDAHLSSGLVQYNKNGELLTLAVKIAPAAEGQVITFEDITRQLLDQRQAAWSDVARRIAHEIKNPLTPIQLATERLKRRYGRQILTDTELFEELTATIIRQVGDLRKMVDEFSSFARLPKPVFRQEDPVDLVRQSLFLQEVGHPEISYSFDAEEQTHPVACDRHQFGQAMTNVLKNAAEAIEARSRDAEPDYRGRIAVCAGYTDDSFTVTVEDNGIGLPQDRERIVEPYVTTREKGTGLGLAIVNKIVEEHGGEMSFTSAESGGTRVTLRFARDPLSARQGSEAAE